jgi:methyltransferase (TIGR00027 family)
MYHVFGFSIKTGYAEWRGPGVNGYLVARDRYVDDIVQKALADGLQQLVILGAGYDSRAYRFDLAGRVKTFEVDHPSTQHDKLVKLGKIFGKVPEHVTYVAIDLNTQLLEDSLLEAGYDPMRKTLFIWQGVTMYLTSIAVEKTLEFVVSHSSVGSAIVFDYVYRDVLEGVQKHSEISNMRRYHFMTGEGLTFGIDEGCAEAWLKERGFRQSQDINAIDLKQAYFTGVNASRRIAEGYGIAIGVV